MTSYTQDSLGVLDISARFYRTVHSKTNTCEKDLTPHQIDPCGPKIDLPKSLLHDSRTKPVYVFQSYSFPVRMVQPGGGRLASKAQPGGGRPAVYQADHLMKLCLTA